MKFVHSSGALRVAQLALVTLLALGAGWQFAVVAGGTVRTEQTVAAARADTAARGAARVAASDPMAGRMGASGHSLVLSPGVPVTVIDGGSAQALRVPRGATSGEVLEAAGVTLAPLDRLLSSVQLGAASGDVIRVIRVSQWESVVREPVAFAVKTIADPTLIAGRTVVVTPGAAGLVENTYQVRAADGAVEERAMISSVELEAPVTEVRRVGTLAPPVPGDIESIIRQAAARWGADADQLLRVGYCESHYNPNAYNASSGASGLFQFLASTWAYQSPKAGYAGASVFDPVANANTAAMMFAAGQARQWVCK